MRLLREDPAGLDSLESTRGAPTGHVGATDRPKRLTEGAGREAVAPPVSASFPRRPVLLLAFLVLLACFAGDPAPLGATPDPAVPPPWGLTDDASVAAFSNEASLPRQGVAFEVSPSVQALAGATLVGGHAYGFLRELTRKHGPRLTSSRAHVGAARWALETFRKMGVDSARIEEFDLKSGWARGPATLRLVEPFVHEMSAEALGWAPAPAGGSLTAELVLVANLGDAAARANELTGKAILMARADTTRDLAGRQRAIEALSEAGVVAIVSRGRRLNNAPNARACYGCGDLVAPFPMIEVGLEDGSWLEGRIKEGKATISLTNASRLTGPVKVPNVVAEVRGREKPEEYVLVGAHLDSWDFATGAQDNGAGVAQVLEAARAIVASGVRPRRSIRFALWAGEEQGFYGSRAYAKAHARELDRLVAVVNTDHGAGAPKGWWLDARPELLSHFAPLAKRLFAGLGAADLKDEFHCDTDHCPFVLEGIPTFNLEVEDDAYNDVHHSTNDTLDEVNEQYLAAGAACVVTAVYALADLPERIGPRLSHAQVTENLKASGALEDMIAEGYYHP